MRKKNYFDADEFSMLAKHYNKKGDNSEAERVVNMGLDLHSHSSELMILKAKLLVASKKHEIAYDYLLTISEDEANLDILLLKFECLIKLNRKREADSFLDYILKGELNDDDLYKFITEVAYLYNDADEHDTAIMLLEKALNIDHTNMNVLIELAYAYEMEDNLDKAIEITNAILDLDPYSFDGWVSLGSLYSYNYEYELSIDAFDFALAIKESDVSVLKLKALTHNLDDNYEEELKLLNQCIDASPDDVSLYESILVKYEEMDEYFGTDHHEEVLNVLKKKAERFGPKGVLLKMAHIYLSWDKYEQAKEIYTRIPEDDKKALEYYTLEGDLAIRKDDYVSAEASYMLAMLEFPKEAEVLDRLAEINLELDKYEKSAEYLKQLIAVDPEYPVAKFRLAFVRFEIGEKEPFDEILNQISDQDVLVMLLNMFSFHTKKEKIDCTQFTREELMIGLDEARENRVIAKSIK
ncbi:MAG: tetratricopeptide repeat protein [Candidatus Saccharimonadaceae bacterium]